MGNFPPVSTSDGRFLVVTAKETLERVAATPVDSSTERLVAVAEMIDLAKRDRMISLTHLAILEHFFRDACVAIWGSLARARETRLYEKLHHAFSSTLEAHHAVAS